jgi:hypothetical protein
MRQLARFSISTRDEDFVLHIEDAAGEKLDFYATPDQLDVVVEALDEMLAANEQHLPGGQFDGPALRRTA